MDPLTGNIQITIFLHSLNFLFQNQIEINKRQDKLKDCSVFTDQLYKSRFILSKTILPPGNESLSQ